MKKAFLIFFRTIIISILFLLIAPIPAIIFFRWIDPPSSSYIIQHKISNMFSEKSCREIKQTWTDIEKISPNLQMTVIASEDQKFSEHFGFDIESIEKALSNKRKRMRGASTITQQTARNLFLWPGRSWIRKGAEAYITVLLELLWSKKRILEVYLNIAQFDSCIYGAGAASQFFFHKSAARLSVYQSSLMAAVLPNPVRFKIEKPSNYIRGRTVHISFQIYQLGGKGYLKKIK